MLNNKNVQKQNNKKVANIILLVIVMLLFYFISSYIFDDGVENETEISSEESNFEESKNEDFDTNKVEGELILTMINVGQADSFLLEQNGHTALIDCGTRSTGKEVVEYLKENNIKRLDYVFGTHPHDDHMGGMYDVITNFEVGKVIIPEIKDSITTNWFIKLIEELSNGKYDVEIPSVGEIYKLGDATMTVIGPISEPNGNTNNYSTVLKVSFGEMDIIMTGDAETKVEKEILDSGVDLDAEILKVGHHGSDTSTSDEFIDAISPDCALISSKVGNKYNHPIKSTMDKLREKNIEVYRTDECGTVVATITDDDVSFNCEPGDYLSGPELEEREDK